VNPWVQTLAPQKKKKKKNPEARVPYTAVFISSYSLFNSFLSIFIPDFPLKQFLRILSTSSILPKWIVNWQKRIICPHPMPAVNSINMTDHFLHVGASVPPQSIPISVNVTSFQSVAQAKLKGASLISRFLFLHMWFIWTLIHSTSKIHVKIHPGFAICTPTCHCHLSPKDC
jgi:hypothetical protein